jgi:alpha-mannosidase
MSYSVKALLKLLMFPFWICMPAFSQQKDTATLPLNPNVKEIIVICKTHFDIGYTHRVKDLLTYYRTSMIDKALDIMEKTKALPVEQQFSWTAPGWVMLKVVEDWDGQTPARRQRLDEAFTSGRFVTHAVPFTLESESVFPEGIARGFESSTWVCRKYNLPLSRGAKMTDVPSQSNVLATVLVQGGVKFLHLGCNWPSGYVKYPGLFWWEGPDGSRLLTLYSHIYGTSVGLTYPDDWTDHFPRDRTVGTNLIPPADWPYAVWPAIFVTPDNTGPPEMKDIEALFDEARKRMPGVRIRVGCLEDFANALLATHPNIPVIKKEAPDTWIHGYGCDPGGMKTFRNLQPLLPVIEVLNTQLRKWGISIPDPSREISKAYEQSLLYAEHTWGGATSINKYGDAFKNLSPSTYADLEGSWEDKTDYIRTADSIVRTQLEKNLKILAENVKFQGKCYVIYNPLPWRRSEWVKLPDTGQFFFAKDIQACGYQTFRYDEVADADYREYTPGKINNVIENKFYKIIFDPEEGRISSLIDKLTGREWVDPDSEYGLGQYLNERFTFEQTLEYAQQYQQGRAVKAFGTNGDWPHPGMHKPGMISGKEVPYRAAVSRGGNVHTSIHSYGEDMIVEYPADTSNHFPASSLSIRLYNYMPYIDMELTIRDKAKDNWPEADWFCFPFKIEQPVFTVGRTLGIMNPLTDIMDGANRDLYAVGQGVCLTGPDGAGITVCPIDHPLISLDRPGIWKFSQNFVPQKPVVYVNLYNNQWNTNFRYWYPGTWSSRVRIWTFDKRSTVATALQEPSFEARTPLLVTEAEGKSGSLPLSQTGITLSRKGTEITAYKSEILSGLDAGKTPVLFRIWEQAGVSGEIKITFPHSITYSKATPVNLRNEVMGSALNIKNNVLIFDLGAYSPASFILE